MLCEWENSSVPRQTGCLRQCKQCSSTHVCWQHQHRLGREERQKSIQRELFFTSTIPAHILSATHLHLWFDRWIVFPPLRSGQENLTWSPDLLECFCSWTGTSETLNVWKERKSVSNWIPPFLRCKHWFWIIWWAAGDWGLRSTFDHFCRGATTMTNEEC